MELTACLLLMHVLVAQLPQEQAREQLQAMFSLGYIIRIFSILQQVRVISSRFYPQSSLYVCSSDTRSTPEQ